MALVKKEDQYLGQNKFRGEKITYLKFFAGLFKAEDQYLGNNNINLNCAFGTCVLL